jgi:hypothetical protein
LHLLFLLQRTFLSCHLIDQGILIFKTANPPLHTALLIFSHNTHFLILLSARSTLCPAQGQGLWTALYVYLSIGHRPGNEHLSVHLLKVL